MKELSIKDIINNAKDELSRSLDLLMDNEDAYWSCLTSDIDSSLERMADVNDRIEFALLIAYHMGYINSKHNFMPKSDCCSKEMINKCLQAASDVELVFCDGTVASDWEYGAVEAIATGVIAGKLFVETGKATFGR